MRFRFIEEGAEEAREITKNGKIETSDLQAGIHFEFNPDKDGYVLLGVGSSEDEMLREGGDITSQWLSAVDLRETAALLNFLADELDKVK